MRTIFRSALFLAVSIAGLGASQSAFAADSAALRLFASVEAGAGYERFDDDREVADGFRSPAEIELSLVLSAADSLRFRLRSFTLAESSPSASSARQDLALDARLEAPGGIRVTIELSGFYSYVDARLVVPVESSGAGSYLFGELTLDSLGSSFDAGAAVAASGKSGTDDDQCLLSFRTGWTQIAMLKPMLMFRAEVSADFDAVKGFQSAPSPSAALFVRLDDPAGAAFTLAAQYRKSDFESGHVHAFTFEFNIEIRMWENLALFAEYALDCFSVADSGGFGRRHCMTIGLKLESS